MAYSATFNLPAGGLQGGSGVSLQGSSPTIQGSTPTLQGKPITIQGSNVNPATISSSAKVIAGSQQALANKPATTDPYAASIAALQAQIAAANNKVYAPALDLNSIYSQAGQTAQANVNPYYTKQLTDFLAQQATAKTQQQQQTQTNIQNLNDQLAQTQQANALTGSRSAEDTALKEQQIAQAADQTQQDQGTAFDTARNAQAASLSQSGLTGSGLGAGQQAGAQEAHNTTETRQAQTDQASKDAAELLKARTFEDIGTSNTNAGTATTKGVTQANFDLDKFITGQTADLSNEKNSLEQSRLQAVAGEQQNQAKLLINNFINSIANPAQRQAAIQAYG